MQSVIIARETHDLIASRAKGAFSHRRSRFIPEGVELMLSNATATLLRRLSPNPDVAIRNLLLGERPTVH